MSKIIAQIATLNKMILNSSKGIVEREFTPETLEQLAKSAANRPVTLGFNGIQMGIVERAWVEDNSVFVEFEGSSFDRKHLVPGFKTTTTIGNKFKTVRCVDFALTDKPSDKSLKTIQELNITVEEAC